jgi:hypothetical protein
MYSNLPWKKRKFTLSTLKEEKGNDLYFDKDDDDTKMKMRLLIKDILRREKSTIRIDDKVSDYLEKQLERVLKASIMIAKAKNQDENVVTLEDVKLIEKIALL